MHTSFTKEDKRTHYALELSAANIGERVSVLGWAQRQRDLGSLIFIDLRDRTGIVQLAFDENRPLNVVPCNAFILSHVVNGNVLTGRVEIALLCVFYIERTVYRAERLVGVREAKLGPVLEIIRDRVSEVARDE